MIPKLSLIQMIKSSASLTRVKVSCSVHSRANGQLRARGLTKRRKRHDGGTVRLFPSSPTSAQSGCDEHIVDAPPCCLRLRLILIDGRVPSGIPREQEWNVRDVALHEHLVRARGDNE